MNWLQRNLPPRESWAWVIVAIPMVLAYLSAHFQLLQAAFDLAPVWEQRIELFSGLAAMFAAKQGFSWMPSRVKQDQANIEKEFRSNLEKEITKNLEQDRRDGRP
jgi:hypothetical protein